MAEWTPEAEWMLSGYLERLNGVARERGYAPHEIVDEIKAHIVTEAESLA